MSLLIHCLQGFCSVAFLLVGLFLLGPGEEMLLVPLTILVSCLFLRIFPAGSVLCTLLHVPHKTSIGQIVPQINNVFIQGVEGIHYLFSHNLVNEIQPLNLLLEPGDSVFLIVSGVLASVIFLAAFLDFAISGLMILGVPPVVVLVGPVLKIFNFLKEPLNRAKIVDQAVLCIVEKVETRFTNIVRKNQKSRVKELVIVSADY